MKARIKATGKVITVEETFGYPGGYVASNGVPYRGSELELIVDEEPDYWTKLEHQYAGMAMQGMMAHTNIDYDEIVDLCVEFAHALVEKLKKKEERK